MDGYDDYQALTLTGYIQSNQTIERKPTVSYTIINFLCMFASQQKKDEMLWKCAALAIHFLYLSSILRITK